MAAWILDLYWRQLWQITLLVPVMVWLVSRYCRNRPHLAYGLLLVPLVKCLVPPVSLAWPGAFRWIWLDDWLTTTTLAILQANWLSTFLLLGWLLGAVALGGYLWGKRLQLRRFHEDTEILPPDELLEIAEEVSERVGLQHQPRLLVTAHPTIPFAGGAFQPRIVLPDHLVLNASPEDLRLVIAHEMTHLRRGDLFWSSLQLVVQSLYWFHPCVWWLNREIRRVREECCDTEVLTRLSCLPKDYARCLINMLELQQRLRTMPELTGLKPLDVTEARLRNIMRKPQPVSGLNWFHQLLIGLAAVLIIPGGSASVESAATVAAQHSLLQPTVPSSQSPETAARPENPVSVPVPPGENQPPAVAPVQLRYGAIAGDSFGWFFSLQLDQPEKVQHWQGAIHCRIAEADELSFTPELDRTGLIRQADSKSTGRSFGAFGSGMPEFPEPYLGPAIPRGSGLPFPSYPPGFRSATAGPDLFAGAGRPPRRLFDQPSAPSRTYDRSGRIIRQRSGDEFPLLLGNLLDLTFPEVPAEPFTDATVRRSELRSSTLPTPDPRESFPFQPPFNQIDPAAESVAVQVASRWRYVGTEQNLLVLQRRLQVTAPPAGPGVQGSNLELQGEYRWDANLQRWHSWHLQGLATARQPGLEIRVPVTISATPPGSE